MPTCTCSKSKDRTAPHTHTHTHVCTQAPTTQVHQPAPQIPHPTNSLRTRAPSPSFSEIIPQFHTQTREPSCPPRHTLGSHPPVTPRQLRHVRQAAPHTVRRRPPPAAIDDTGARATCPNLHVQRGVGPCPQSRTPLHARRRASRHHEGAGTAHAVNVAVAHLSVLGVKTLMQEPLRSRALVCLE